MPSRNKKPKPGTPGAGDYVGRSKPRLPTIGEMADTMHPVKPTPGVLPPRMMNRRRRSMRGHE